MELKDLRNEIDVLDEQIVDLFQKRMNISADIAKYKLENNMQVFDSSREREKMVKIAGMCEDKYKQYAEVLYSEIFDLSKAEQDNIVNSTSDLSEQINSAIENTEKLFPEYAKVACQGVEGAYSQQACDKLFHMPDILYCKTWENVFSMVSCGMCRYGVLPIENSTAGSVNQIYDMMRENNCYISRSVRLKIDHCLLALPGTKVSDIKEIYTHEQAASQCSNFLKEHPNIVVHIESNTAVASKIVSESGRKDVAAIASYNCAELYGLSALMKSIQDKNNNYTSFICISKKLEIYPGADRTSIMIVLGNRPGSLHKVLSRMYALGINVVKLESRPIPERDFEFLFYFDLDTQVYSDRFVKLICSLDGLCDEFKYFGSYSEII